MSRQRTRWVVIGAALWSIFLILGLVVAKQPLPLDVAIRNSLFGGWQEPHGRIAEVLSAILGPVLPFAVGLYLAVFAIRAWRRNRRDQVSILFRIAVVMLLCRLTSVAFKPIFFRDRPREYPDLSYPSGHVTAVASASFATVLVCIWFAPQLLRRVMALGIVLTIISALNRIILGVHWFTDTIGAVCAVVGVGLIAATVLQLMPTRKDALSRYSESA